EPSLGIADGIQFHSLRAAQYRASHRDLLLGAYSTTELTLQATSSPCPPSRGPPSRSRPRRSLRDSTRPRAKTDGIRARMSRLGDAKLAAYWQRQLREPSPAQVLDRSANDAVPLHFGH